MTTLETRRALFTAQENSKGKSVDFAYFERKGRTGALVSRERRRCHGFTHLKKNPLTEATESEKFLDRVAILAFFNWRRLIAGGPIVRPGTRRKDQKSFAIIGVLSAFLWGRHGAHRIGISRPLHIPLFLFKKKK